MPAEVQSRDDLLSLYLKLAPSRGTPMSLLTLREQFGDAVDALLANGAAELGQPLKALRCPSCYEDHTAEVAFDEAIGRSSIFCPEAGFVPLENARLASLHLNGSWLLDRLTAALDIRPSPPRRTIIEKAAWHLGDTQVGRTNISIALAIGIHGNSELDQLIEGLKRRTPLDTGLLLYSSCQLPSRFEDISGYHALDLTELIVVNNGALFVNQERLSARVRGILRGEVRAVTGQVGRPSLQDRVLGVFTCRRERNEPYSSKLAEATAIQAEWSRHHPDEAPPAGSTIRRHLPAIGS